MQQLELTVCYGRSFDSKDAILWNGVDEDVNGCFVNDVQYTSEEGHVRNRVAILIKTDDLL